MTQTVYDGTAGADSFDASGEGTKEIAVFRSLGAGDSAIGGTGGDRFSFSGGALVDGGAGNDSFFTTLHNAPISARDTIDGGTGTDLLNIGGASSQLTDAVKAELVRLEQYLAGDTTQHFVSDILHIDMVNVESANIRVDGTVKTLAEVAPLPVATVSVGFGNAFGGPPYTEDGFTFSGSGSRVTDSYLGNIGRPLSADGGGVLATDYFGASVFGKAGGGSFGLVSIDVFNAADATIKGYSHGVEIDSMALPANAAWHTVTLNWTGLDQVKLFSPSFVTYTFSDAWVFS